MLARSRFILSEIYSSCRLYSQWVIKFKFSFHILPSSGKSKNSRFQLVSYKEQPTLICPGCHRSCPVVETVFSRDHPFIPGFPRLNGHSSGSNYREPYAEHTHQPGFQPPTPTSTLFLSSMPLQWQISQEAALRRQQKRTLLPSGGDLVKCALHFSWNYSLSGSQFFKLGILLSFCFIYIRVVKR